MVEYIRPCCAYFIYFFVCFLVCWMCTQRIILNGLSYKGETTRFSICGILAILRYTNILNNNNNNNNNNNYYYYYNDDDTPN